MTTINETWQARDEPVLRAVARLLEETSPGMSISGAEIIAATGFGEDAVVRAVLALGGPYLEIKAHAALAGPAFVQVFGLTERGRRIVGFWPTDDIGQDLIRAIENAADATTDDDERSALRRWARAVGGVSRDVVTDVLAAVITKQVNAV